MKYQLLLVLLLFPSVIAAQNDQYHMKLLAVSEVSGQDEGMVADLYLEIKPGSGRVFIDTFPLTKVDTQISTRFAKSIACNYLDYDCSGKDFFYTIRSGSTIVGGPSAGAALAALTVIALKDHEFDSNIAVSGTINSGGLVGPVGGLEAKIRGAKQANLTMVLIPRGERIVRDLNDTNKSTDLYQIGRDIEITVKEVATLDEVLFEFTGIQPKKTTENISVSEDYSEVMRDISNELCKRSELLSSRALLNATLTKEALNLTNRAYVAIQDNNYYTGASYCFGANIKLSNQILIEENITQNELQKRIQIQKDKLSEFEEEIEARPLNTITDLQAFEIVKERIVEADNYFDQSLENLQKNDTASAQYLFSYGIERVNSAISWSRYFSVNGKKLNINSESLKNTCIQKLSEAEERYQYVQLYMPLRLENTRIALDRAHQDLASEDYELCLFKATKAKAEADVVLSALSIGDEQLDDYIALKLSIARDQIAKQAQNGHFPILGYSYYEYANSLRETDKYSALIYAEYALELSNLDIYFSNNGVKFRLDTRLLSVFILGIAFGVLLTAIFGKRISRKSR